MKNVPANIEAEQALIGSILIEPEKLDNIVSIVSSSDFYDQRHRYIFSVIEQLHDEGLPIDIISVCDRLRNQDLLDKIGGELYVAQLADSVPTSAHAEIYAQIIRDKAILRELIAAGSQIVQNAYTDVAVDEILDEAERLVFRIAESRATKTYIDVKSALTEVFEHLEELREKHLKGLGGLVTGIPTGFKKLDEMTSGFHRSDLIIIAARPSVGKTAFALNLAKNMALVGEASVGIFSLEMSREQLIQRLLCMESLVDLQKVRRGWLSDDEWKRLVQGASKLMKANIIVDDESNLEPRVLRAKARRMKKEYNVDAIFIDYLQLMNLGDRRDSRQQEISEISRSLKLLARELDISIIALSQLSRAVEQREDKRPRLSDLRESGAIEQDADVVIFLYRDEYYKKQHVDLPHETEIIIGKQRNGPIGTVTLMFNPSFTNFFEADAFHSNS
ncbi:replicative DNA helicase [Fervidobacterium nodosum]|uniref:Replicative DNA helicase n=1 Tax=Fervidobacterium nodosum (strain ATCC 35602 / DSM 5306 / Rt17-B1) TaxID=381764 RepID=A7HKT9_FERNB|nr:replicative DNA helicase [Fervidobacterium nodosum]ABS60522.1 replicative DNA helicase [Fervidobacterium nodosum Rt17-B1]PHJ12553.1 DNA helicase [Fervidobacterium sp. SC_NGM5_G05]